MAENVKQDPGSNVIPSQGSTSRLRRQLQASVQNIQWTYSVFWHFSHREGSLVWRDGFYNGVIRTRKTVQPMELSADELSDQRSIQLRELFESLSAEQPARRPCAALSPEDLSETEWFYLMCMSFSFAPSDGLPGKALAKRHHIWLSRADQVDSKTFSRAILAKSAGIQTILCIPFIDGVVEFGTTDLIQEDIGTVENVKSMMAERSKPVCSEQSTSNPRCSENVDDPPCPHNFSIPTYNHEHHMPSKSDTEVAITVTTTNNTATVAELDISAEDCSNEVCSDIVMDTSPTPINPWPPINSVGASQGKYLERDDSAHYSRTVSSILMVEDKITQEVEAEVEHECSPASAFTTWTFPETIFNTSQQNQSQTMLKFILTIVPTLHGDDGENTSKPRRNSQSPEDITVSHVLAERRRREKLNERFIVLRGLVPFVTKMDKASILGDTIEYVKQLRRKVQELESKTKQLEGDLKKEKESNSGNISGEKKRRAIDSGGEYAYSCCNVIDLDVVDKETSTNITSNNNKHSVTEMMELEIEVSIIEREALVEMKCPWREGLLLELMHTLSRLQLEPHSIHSFLQNHHTFVATIRGKVKVSSNGEKPTISRVKSALRSCILRERGRGTPTPNRCK